jgi:hypothetical protein
MRSSKRILWTKADLKTLRALARKRSVPAIGKFLKRSPAAIRFKAWQLRLSLKVKRATAR